MNFNDFKFKLQRFFRRIHIGGIGAVVCTADLLLELYSFAITLFTNQLNSNNITAISDNICFPQLLIFDVSYNQLIELPNISIIMPKLKTLDASFNSLKKVPVLPQSLINLYLHHNIAYHHLNLV